MNKQMVKLFWVGVITRDGQKKPNCTALPKTALN